MQSRRKVFNGAGSPPATLIALVMAAIALVLCGGYYFGGKVQSKRSEPITADIHFKENVLRREAGACNLAVAKMLEAKSELLEGLAELKKEVDQLDAKNSELHSRHERYEQEASECSVKAEMERSQFNEETERRMREFNAEKTTANSLRDKLEQLTEGRGSRMVLEIQALKSMRKLHYGLRKALQAELPIGDDTLPTIEAELLTKWGTHLDNETLFSNSGRRYEMMNFVKKWVAWEYDPSKHTEILAIQRDSSGEVVPAIWNGAPMKKPIGIDDASIPPQLNTATLSDTIVSMYEAVLCSYRRNATRIPVPAAFMWYPKNIRSHLTTIVDSPVLTFCFGCSDPRTGQQFTLACGTHSIARLYGSYPFWAMRSLLRFTAKVYSEADRIMALHELEEGGDYIAIVNHVSSTARVKCHNHERMNYGLHRLWIEHNFGTDSIIHMSADRESQCAPSESDVRKAIETDGRGMKGSLFGHRAKVYLSAPDVNTDAVKSESVNIISIPIRSAFDEAVDMVIASRAKRIIVSPFFAHSQIVTELFLLRNELDPQGVRFF